MDDLLRLAQGAKDSAVFQNLSPALQTALFLCLLAFVPALLVSVTAYTRIVIVLSFVRKAVSTQEVPPNLVLTGLALFLTLFVMGPTIDEIPARRSPPTWRGKCAAWRRWCGPPP
jgi:flagellar biosynthetic protein FliP